MAGSLLCAGCGKPLGAKGSPPMRNMGAFGTIHGHPDCARKATVKHYEAEKETGT